MHMLLNKRYPITRDLFNCDEEMYPILDKTIDMLNELRDKYLEAKNGEEKNLILEKAK